ncbi:GtrA family protein [Bacillus niameyensis]|uniref:GtrA family protein n=1 Tax=Bacillus niameyensis TaxID=1522308 RepID=UPI000784B082|nr:GtrA family protein [Bacillus niameyensis]
MLRHSFLRFLLVGVMNTIVGLSIMYLCLSLFHWNYWVSTLIGNAVGAVVSYFLNKRFTFQSQAAFSTSAFRFVLVIVVCYFVSYKIGLVVTEWGLEKSLLIPMTYVNEVAVLIGSGLYTITNYLGQKFFVFNK